MHHQLFFLTQFEMVAVLCIFFSRKSQEGQYSSVVLLCSILENGLTNEVPLARSRQQIVGAEKSHQLLAPFFAVVEVPRLA